MSEAVPIPHIVWKSARLRKQSHPIHDIPSTPQGREMVPILEAALALLVSSHQASFDLSCQLKESGPSLMVEAVQTVKAMHDDNMVDAKSGHEDSLVPLEHPTMSVFMVEANDMLARSPIHSSSELVGYEYTDG
ncbi:hypothetical protein AMTR_s00161p00030590 [Amborella trichopoda]|uniref:Uncharacterized protein n=1 Tax=Amborella trichopoda TaxID=13333 RepID=W1PRK5_AMBTC|nr:hypothetical protein AMTR_s00161p00030590 [Amborella trichopoda]